uniref:NADH-ubiquinone oxidoreductase chain 6 n=1 Tax=Dinocras cephalotes TaxID=441509 RepID=U5TQI9_DINCE|nr:NADH dehydrogenase subunit 6 [Dinocras cephalotes]AGZ03524.1 NADH dehydrogenase subunit 6 [Dinocras cephalotes]
MLNLLLLAASSTLALIFTQMTHPLAMGLMLLLQTFLVCLITGLSTQSFWFSYILFLVFLGGLLVLFIYVTSLASNEMFSLSMFSLMISTLTFTTALILLYFSDSLLLTHSIQNTDMTPLTWGDQMEEAPSLMKLYNPSTSLITLMLVLYLLLTLIVVVKITKISSGPLRPIH